VGLSALMQFVMCTAVTELQRPTLTMQSMISHPTMLQLHCAPCMHILQQQTSFCDRTATTTTSSSVVRCIRCATIAWCCRMICKSN
jgi:hypothetical protein